MKSGKIWRLLLLLCAVLLPAAAMASGCRGYYPVSYVLSGDVTVTIAMGTRSPLSEARTVPVSVTVSGDYAKAGNCVTLTVPTNTGDFYCYRQAVTTDGKQEFVFVVPPAKNSSQMVAEVLGVKGNVIYSRTCTYQFSATEGKDGEIVIGMIGMPENTDIWNFSYSSGDEHYLLRTARILPENLLAHPEAYDSYSLLVINGSAAEQISEEQKEGICGWAAGGGTLLLLGNIKTAQQLGLSAKTRVESVGITGNAVFNGYEEGKGILWLSRQGILDADYTQGEQINLLEILLRGGTDGMNRESQFARSRDQMTQVLTEALDCQENIDVEADSRVYYGIFVVYLLIVLPGIYLLLRRRDRMRFFRLSVGISACLVSVVIWTAGSQTRFSKPFLHSLYLAEYDGTQMREKIFFSVQAPYNQAYEVSLSPEYEVKPLHSAQSWSGLTYSNYDRHTVELERTEEDVRLRMDNLIAFSPRYFEMDRKEKSVLRIEGEISWGSEMTDAVLTNRLGSTLANAAVLIGDRVWLLPEWKEGETVVLSQACGEERCITMSLEQFLEEAYRSNGIWDTQYREIYELLLTRESRHSFGYPCVLAQKEQTVSVQENTAYGQSSVSFVLAEVIGE